MGATGRETWAVIGTSPSAARRIGEVPEEATTIACNAAIDLFCGTGRRLDYYLLYDAAACRKWSWPAYRLQDEGTLLVTLKRSDRALADRNLSGFDEFIHAESGHSTDPTFQRGYYRNLRLSGLYSLAFAVNNGAKRVLMLGMEGYENHQAGKVTLIIRPVTQAIIDACPDVQFEFWGEPRYRLTGENLILTEGFASCV
jgi:hypothetical protein